MFRARTNTLNFSWRKRFVGEDTTCKLCSDGVEETLEHFICKCERLRELRQEFGVQNCTLKEILLFYVERSTERILLIKTYLQKIWSYRKRQLNEVLIP